MSARSALRSCFKLTSFCSQDLLEIPQYSLFCEGVWGCQTGLYVAIHRPKLVKSLLLASPGWMIE